MSKKTIICLWWIKDSNFKIIIEGLSLRLKIGVLKILILIAIKSSGNNESILISLKEVSLEEDVMIATLFWLSKIKIIKFDGELDLMNIDKYLIFYSDHEKYLRETYEDCWVELPTQNILNLIKSTSSNEQLTYDAIINYLMMTKGYKIDNFKLKKLFYDEEYLKGNYIGTWRELLVKYDLVEFLDVGYVEIY